MAHAFEQSINGAKSTAGIGRSIRRFVNGISGQGDRRRRRRALGRLRKRGLGQNRRDGRRGNRFRRTYGWGRGLPVYLGLGTNRRIIQRPTYRILTMCLSYPIDPRCLVVSFLGAWVGKTQESLGEPVHGLGGLFRM